MRPRRSCHDCMTRLSDPRLRRSSNRQRVEAQRERTTAAGLAQGSQIAHGVRYAQRGPPRRTRPPGRTGGCALSDSELFRLELYNSMRSRLEEVDPRNRELQKQYVTGPEGFVPSQAEVYALGRALEGARSGGPTPPAPVNTFDNPGGPGAVRPAMPSLLNNGDLRRPGGRQEPQTVVTRPPGVIDESEARFEAKERGGRGTAQRLRQQRQGCSGCTESENGRCDRGRSSN